MTNPLDDKFADRYDPTRHHDENHGIQNQPADKFADRSSAARTAPRLPGPAERESPVPSLTAARSPRLGLSLTQILGSTGAAVTAAFLGSRLGVAGTLIGAALASVISVVGGAVYTSSIKATKLLVAQAIVAVRVPDGGVGSPGTPRPAPIPTPAAPRPPEPARVPQANQRSRRPALRGAVAASLLCTAVFAGTLVVVTGYESVSGTALSGGQAGSLTILGGQALDGSAAGLSTTTEQDGNRSGATSSTGSLPVTGGAPARTPSVTGGPAATTAPATGAPTSPATTSPATTSAATTSPATSPATTSPATTSPASTSPATTPPATTPTSPAPTPTKSPDATPTPTSPATAVTNPSTEAPATGTPTTTAAGITSASTSTTVPTAPVPATATPPDNGTGPR